MRLHHIGIVVKDLALSGEAYARALGVCAQTQVFLDPIQKVRVQFWGSGSGSLVELIEPTGPDSPVWRECQKGGGLNHLCYEASNLDATVKKALEEGALLTREVAPAVAFGGRRIAFLYSLELGLIEFVEL